MIQPTVALMRKKIDLDTSDRDRRNAFGNALPVGSEEGTHLSGAQRRAPSPHRERNVRHRRFDAGSHQLHRSDATSAVQSLQADLCQ